MAKNFANNRPGGLLRLDYTTEPLCFCLTRSRRGSVISEGTYRHPGCRRGLVDRAKAAPFCRPAAGLMRQLAAALLAPPLRLRLLSRSPGLERHCGGGARSPPDRKM